MLIRNYFTKHLIKCLAVCFCALISCFSVHCSGSAHCCVDYPVYKQNPVQCPSLVCATLATRNHRICIVMTLPIITLCVCAVCIYTNTHTHVWVHIFTCTQFMTVRYMLIGWNFLWLKCKRSSTVRPRRICWNTQILFPWKLQHCLPVLTGMNLSGARKLTTHP